MDVKGRSPVETAFFLRQQAISGNKFHLLKIKELPVL